MTDPNVLLCFKFRIDFELREVNVKETSTVDQQNIISKSKY